MIRHQALHNDLSGNVTMLLALGAFVLCGMAGGAVDYGRAYSARSKIQSAADAAALAGATADASERIAIATRVFNLDFPGTNPETIVDGSNFTVTANLKLPTTLLGVIGIREVPIKATATAIIGAADLASAGTCILLLHPSDIGLYVNADSKLDASCGLHINSSHSTEALFANSLSSLTTTSTCVTGQARLNSNSTAMSPGVYCNTTLINSGGRAIMQAGSYIFRGGELIVNSGSSVSGDGVMMFFADRNARLNVNSDSTLDLSAPSNGTYQGVLVFQSRDSANDGARPFIVNSESSSRLQGTIYLPRGTLEVNSHSVTNQTASYTAIVAQKMVLNSFGTFTVNWNTASSTPLPPLLQTATGSRLTH